jgi:hypothetical protein
MDVSALRAEIKAWERDFKAQNGAEPTVQDIKDRPHIGTRILRFSSAFNSPFTSGKV